MKVESSTITRAGVKITEGKRWAQVYQATYQIMTDGIQNAIRVQTDARNAAALPHPVPVKGAAYSVASETDLSSFAQEFSWHRDPGNALRWFCDVTWRPLDPRDNPANIQVQNPVLRAPTLWWEFEETTELVREAKNITDLPGRPAGTVGPLVNAAGRPFDVLPERPRSLPVLVVQRYYSTLEKVRKLHERWYHKLNGDIWQNAAIGTLLVRRINCSQPMFEGDIQYYSGTIYIAYDPLGWKHRLVNQGLGYIDPAESDTARKYKTYDKNGQPFSEPVLLTAQGDRLPNGQQGNVIEYEYGDKVMFNGVSGSGGYAAIDQEPA